MLKRWLLIGAGTFFFGMAILGVFVPLLPSTPFVLLAAACYVRSSETLYQKLQSNRWTGPAIRNFHEGKGMPRRAKITTVFILWSSLIISAVFVDLFWVRMILLAVGVGVSLFVWKKIPQSGP